jgi:hypothetical protein
MEKFDRHVVQWFIDTKPEDVERQKHRLAEDAYLHVGYDEEEATELLQRIIPEMPPADIANAAKQAAHLWDSLASTLSDVTPITETLDKVTAALAEVGQTDAMTILGLYVLARDSVLREAAIRQAIPNVMRSSGAATKRHGTPELQEQLAKAIHAIWAKGEYRTRPECAYHEHKRLGMTETAANTALRGTPDPDPWPAKGKEHLKRAD